MFVVLRTTIAIEIFHFHIFKLAHFQIFKLYSYETQ